MGISEPPYVNDNAWKSRVKLARHTCQFSSAVKSQEGSMQRRVYIISHYNPLLMGRGDGGHPGGTPWGKWSTPSQHKFLKSYQLHINVFTVMTICLSLHQFQVIHFLAFFFFCLSFSMCTIAVEKHLQGLPFHEFLETCHSVTFVVLDNSH